MSLQPIYTQPMLCLPLLPLRACPTTRHRPSQQKHFPPSRRLLFHVLKGMPRLELSIAGLPTTAAAGELLRVQV